MKVLIQPKHEEDILRPVAKHASEEDVMRNMRMQAECCVVHLCGCSCDHSGC